MTTVGQMLSDEERAERLGQLTDLIEMVRPVIQQDGGDLVLVGVDVEVGTGGAAIAGCL